MGVEYIKGSLKQRILYGGAAGGSQQILLGFIDFDYVRCINIRKSILGYLFTFFGSIVS